MKSINYIALICFISVTSIFAQWESRTNGLPDDWAIGLAIEAVDSVVAVISLRMEGPEKIFITTDAGNNWKDISPFTENFDEGVDISMIDQNNIWVAVSNNDSARILYTSDQGVTWITQFKDTSLTKYFNYIEMFDLYNGIAMGDSYDYEKPALFLSTKNGGNTWTSVNNSKTGSLSGDTWRRLDFVSKDIGFFFESGTISKSQKLLKTIDGGIIWQPTTYSPGLSVLKFFNGNLGIVFRGNYNSDNIRIGGLINRTLDGGNSWEIFEMDALGWGNDFEFIPNDPSQLWFVDRWGHGLFYSSDTGRTWTKNDYSDIELAGRDIVFVDAKHGWILGDNGNLLFTNNNGGLITDIEEVQKEIIPDNFTLEQNYPNPFNPTTTIKYSIPNVASDFSLRKVTLKVYDIIGNEIAELVNAHKPAGNYEITFDASNLSSGVYYYQLVSGGFIQTRKMVLIK